MSNVNHTSSIGLEAIELLPREITTNPTYNVRPFSSCDTDAEDKLIEELANSMERCGQLDSILITPKRELICGHRRRKAAIVINERRSVLGQSLFHLRCNVDHSGGDLWQKAITSNLHRKESSVMDFAYLITQVRAKFGWKGTEGYTRVAEYLGVDRTTIYAAERFLSAPGHIQTKLHTGELTQQSAILLMKVPGEQQQVKAVELARQYQEEDDLEKALEQSAKTRNKAGATARIVNLHNKAAARIKAPAIVRAIRDIGTEEKVPLSKLELLESIAKLDQPNISPSHHEFITYLLSYAKGYGTFKELRTRFDLIGIALPLTADLATTHSPPN